MGLGFVFPMSGSRFDARLNIHDDLLCLFSQEITSLVLNLVHLPGTHSELLVFLNVSWITPS
jgi:hypothetical protein